MCASTKFVKEDGFYVCENCGTKYSVEEAKKLMIEGAVQITNTVDVQGTVKVDNAVLIENALQNARRAMDKTDWEEAVKYYNKAEEYDPDNIEALFFSTYAKLRIEKYNPDSHDPSVMRIFKKSLSVISDYYDTTTEDKKSVLFMIDSAIKAMRGRGWIRSRMDTTGRIVDDELTIKYYNKEILEPFATELKQIYKKHNEQYIQDLINGLEPKTKLEGKYTGCYVATCVYGSYNCPQVWTLRRYRDNTLATTWYGRAFIRCYYAISPTLVKWFGETKWFKKMWQGKLDRMVKKLQDRGVESTPYEDKNW
ncbi:MAG: hypothetical protein E7369_05165 [Clostridiales bacterium]|nr:hypothetical protein [Clostridiales bacterium]